MVGARSKLVPFTDERPLSVIRGYGAARPETQIRTRLEFRFRPTPIIRGLGQISSEAGTRTPVKRLPTSLKTKEDTIAAITAALLGAAATPSDARAATDDVRD